LVGKHLTSAFSKELVFALDICEQAGKVAMRHWSAGVKTISKDDGSPVTIADTECERMIRVAIEKAFPNDCMLGEEEGETKNTETEKTENTRKWIIDPIDGTYGYARGMTVFSTLLALEENGEVILGVVSAPAANEIYWAEKGKGAWRNGQRIEVSTCTDLSQSQFNFGGLKRIFQRGFTKAMEKIVVQTARQRCPGDYLSFAQVFEGKAEASLEIGVKPWDLAPMKIIIEEAGGTFSDMAGGKSIYLGDCLVTNGHLEKAFAELLTI
jgi:histidinol-phosphatase